MYFICHDNTHCHSEWSFIVSFNKPTTQVNIYMFCLHVKLLLIKGHKCFTLFISPCVHCLETLYVWRWRALALCEWKATTKEREKRCVLKMIHINVDKAWVEMALMLSQISQRYPIQMMFNYFLHHDSEVCRLYSYSCLYLFFFF